MDVGKNFTCAKEIVFYLADTDTYAYISDQVYELIQKFTGNPLTTG